jgi:hypothetical protein
MIVAEPKRRWLVTCSCGWERECVSAWGATPGGSRPSAGPGPPVDRPHGQRPQSL